VERAILKRGMSEQNLMQRKIVELNERVDQLTEQIEVLGGEANSHSPPLFSAAPAVRATTTTVFMHGAAQRLTQLVGLNVASKPGMEEDDARIREDSTEFNKIREDSTQTAE
jgi:hypothetical protein